MKKINGITRITNTAKPIAKNFKKGVSIAKLGKLGICKIKRTMEVTKQIKNKINKNIYAVSFINVYPLTDFGFGCVIMICQTWHSSVFAMPTPR